jgi:hypothetical protein
VFSEAKFLFFFLCLVCGCVKGGNERPTERIKFSLDQFKMKSPFETFLPLARGTKDPAFLADKDWTQSVIDEFWPHFLAQEPQTASERFPPLGLVRCSRGGKTRALLEIAHHLRNSVGETTAVIFVSFNADTSMEDEIHNPLGALCRRIAFASLEQNETNFDQFRNVDVEPDVIKNWLGGTTPCILLIDELNQIDMTKRNEKFSSFLKSVFLRPANRYLIFSSHVISTVHQCSGYLDSNSNRPALLRALPLASSMDDVRSQWGWDQLTLNEFLYYGRIPALLWQYRNSYNIYVKRKEAIDAIKKEISDGAALQLLSTFITGEQDDVLPDLLQLMDAMPSTSQMEQGKVRWIPAHMVEVLGAFLRDPVSDEIRCVVQQVQKMLNKFSDVKPGSGEGWECIFSLALLIRIMTKQEHPLLPFLANMRNYGVSFNFSFNSDAKNVNDMLKGLRSPDSFPHVNVCVPSSAAFVAYDTLVVVSDAPNSRRIYGYQMKEGNGLVTTPAAKEVSASFIFRGGSDMSCEQGWTVASQEDILNFLGITGQDWAPSKWQGYRTTTRDQRQKIYNKKKVAELKQILTQWKLDQTGNKTELIDRLLDAEFS